MGIIVAIQTARRGAWVLRRVLIFKYNFTKGGRRLRNVPVVALTLLCFSIPPVNNYTSNKQQIFFHSVSNCLHSSDRCAI